MAANPFRGSWRITHMDQWDEDFVDLVVSGFVRFDGTAGEFAFGAVAGEMHCIVGRRDGEPIVEWTWAGHDEEDEASGRGWARLFNNLFSYAGGGVDRMTGTVFTGIDRTRTTTDPLTLAFLGNVISVPFVSGWHLASLMACRPLPEFGGLVVTEAALNLPGAHECHGGLRASWASTRNAAFTSPPGMGARAVVELLADGYPVEDNRTFVVGEAPDTVPLASEVASDIGENPRSTPPGVGAWEPR